MKNINIKKNNKSFNVLIAEDLLSWKDGLKGNKIKYCDGLLMVFPDVRLVNITMMDMLFDVDIFWINSDGIIIKKMKNVKKPKSNDDLDKIIGVNCKYLLELYSLKNTNNLFSVGDNVLNCVSNFI